MPSLAYSLLDARINWFGDQRIERFSPRMRRRHSLLPPHSAAHQKQSQQTFWSAAEHRPLDRVEIPCGNIRYLPCGGLRQMILPGVIHGADQKEVRVAVFPTRLQRAHARSDDCPAFWKWKMNLRYKLIKTGTSCWCKASTLSRQAGHAKG